MAEVKNGSRWFTISMMAISLIVGAVSVGGVAKLEINALDAEVDAVKLEQTDRLGRLEQKMDTVTEDIGELKEDFKAIRQYVEKRVEEGIHN